MGQKTNPNILRIGKTKEWKSKYVEKKSTESSTLIFRDLEIKKFIYQLFIKNELKIQNCRVYYSESSLHIYVSYYNAFNPLSENKKIKSRYTVLHSKIFHNETSNIAKSNRKRQVYTTKNYKSIFLKHPKLKLLENNYFLKEKTQRLNIINDIKTCKDGLRHKNLSHQDKNLFVSKVLKGLALFTSNNHNIFLNLKQINKETLFFQTISKKNKHKLKENTTKLRRFQQNEFFKKGLNILAAFASNGSSASFLAEFISSYLKKLKRPNFFLRFLKVTLQTLINENFSKFERVQIKVKGRFNGAPRSSHKFINIGRNIPVLTLNAKIDYGESTAYTSNGTFGIKIWTYTKTKKTNTFNASST